MDSGTTVDKVSLAWGDFNISLTFTSWPSLPSFVGNLILCRFSCHIDRPSSCPVLLPQYRAQGENARLSSFIGAIAIADLVKTTLGPKGMDKILQRISEHDQSVTVTNDGATILKSINLDNAAAKVLVDIARVQDDEVGDGTTSVAVLCGELL